MRTFAPTDSNTGSPQEPLTATPCTSETAFVEPLTLDPFLMTGCRACGTPRDFSRTAPPGPGGCGQLLSGPQCAVHLLPYQWLPCAGRLRILQPGWALLPCRELLSWHQVRTHPCPTVRPRSGNRLYLASPIKRQGPSSQLID